MLTWSQASEAKKKKPVGLERMNDQLWRIKRGERID